MMKLLISLAGVCLAVPSAVCAQEVPQDTGTAAQASDTAEGPSRKQATSARDVVEVQLRQPPRRQPRQLSRQERQRLTERYLEAMGTPVDRAAASSSGPR
jgi:hypothetical protein